MKLSVYEFAKALTFLIIFFCCADVEAAEDEYFIFEGQKVYVMDTQVDFACNSQGFPCDIANPYFGYIYVNEDFMHCAYNIQEAILWHEKGHLEFNHWPSLFQIVQRRRGVIVPEIEQMEIEADWYSAEAGYAIELLTLFKVIETLYGKQREVTLRINALKKWIYERDEFYARHY